MASSMATLEDLFVHELKDIYSAERQITKALPKMAKAAQSDALRAGFEEHLAQTEQHIERLEAIFSRMGVSPGRQKCAGMEGLLKEGQQLLDEHLTDDVRDAGMIAAAQKVEHYEIAAYGTLAAYARLLGMEDALALLEETLDEEKRTDRRLTDLAESSVNFEAQSAASDS